MTAAAAGGPYVMALRAKDLFADPTYQRDVDLRRVRAMAAEFDPRLLGVIDVSSRDGGFRFAILDGQHRHALLLEVSGADTPIVCQVYEGLSVDDEARLFHEINVRRKALNFWDRWKARRASGDERVLLIEALLANHGLRVNPAPAEGNVIATVALDTVVDEIGDHYLLDEVVTVLLSAFGRSRDAFQGSVLQGLAYVLALYPPDELDRDRLVRQLSELPVRQLRARAIGMRETLQGRIPRLIAAVIVDQYNRGGGRKVESLLVRMPNGMKPPAIRERWHDQRVTDYANPVASSSAGAAPPRAVPVEVPTPATRRVPPVSPTSAAAPALCRCTHSVRLHEDGDGYCMAGCNCAGYAAAVA